MPQTYIVMTAQPEGIDWLCHLTTPEDATAAMAEWLGQAQRDEEDAAWIVPVLAFARAGASDNA